MLTLEGCRARQRRLLTVMERNRWDFFLTANYRTVYYLTGSLSLAETPTIFWMKNDGRSILITSLKGEAAAGTKITFSNPNSSRASRARIKCP